METFFERLESVVEEREISFPQLAEAIGTAVSTTYRWRDGTVPQRRTLKLIADYLDVMPAWLARGEEPKHNETAKIAKANRVNEPSQGYGSKTNDPMAVAKALEIRIARLQMTLQLALDEVEQLKVFITSNDVGKPGDQQKA